MISFYPVVGRYIRLISLDNNESQYAGVWEAEMWGSEAPVPVELTSFTAEESNNSVVIRWATATETNNKGFEVQKKVSNGFVNIGFVEGNGTTVEKNNYQFIDNSTESGVVTYRLKQVDFDGTFSYSEEIKLIRKNSRNIN